MLNKYFFLLFWLLLPCLVSQESKKEYTLVWSDLNGMETVSMQTSTILNERFEIQKDKPKLIRTQKVQMQYKVYHAIVGNEGDYVIVRILHKDGKIRVDAERKFSMDIDTPEKARQASKHPDIEPYIRSLIGGFVYKINKKTGEVIGTWELVEEEQKIDPKTKKQDVKYKKVFLGKDPQGLSSAFALLPNKSVPVGYEWNRRQMESQTEDLKFVQVLPYKGRKAAAKITRQGTFIKNAAKVGSGEGIFYFDLEYRTTLEHVSKSVLELPVSVQDKNKTRNLLEKITTETKTELLYTNYDLVSKNKANLPK
ncbi:MAG: hypothetical protein HUU50_09860 [Candidatus Brocadiae bacterium]|nr:hypothetical protein [Candidatus Brocadiia bacterium]